MTSGDEGAVSALLAEGADVNETTSGGQTPLILAVIFGHTKVVRLLVKAGADPHVRDNLGLDAIEWAQRRGLTEAVGILTNTSEAATAPRTIVVNVEEPKPFVPPAPPIEPATRETVAPEEKSRRWLAGLKQRLDEREARRLNGKESREPLPEWREPLPESPQLLSSPPEPQAIEEPPPLPAVTKEVPIAETKPTPAPASPEPVLKQEQPPATGRTLVQSTTRPGKRKRCPECNAIYNGDLLSYCAYHTVLLVDADQPSLAEQAKENTPLFWIVLALTIIGSIALGSLITAYIYKSTDPGTSPAAAPQPIIQKGIPEVGGDLAGKAVSLPEAQFPLSGPGPVSGSVTVRVTVDRKGQVKTARGSGGDWLMRGAATEAAMKSTFAPEKLRSRETKGTITYTFKP